MKLEFPVPTLDHVVVNVRDRIDDAADTYRRLGFTLTPRGYHTLGSMNHLAMFGTDYLELIAAKPGDDSRPEIIGVARRPGWPGIRHRGCPRDLSGAATERRSDRPAAAILPPGRGRRWDAGRGVPHDPAAALRHARRTFVFLPASDPRSGLARRMAAPRQRRRRRRPSGDRGRGAGGTGWLVRPHVRPADGSRDR